MVKLEYATIMVTMDALLDTRLATLFMMSPEKTQALLESGNYHSRTVDEFEGFDREEFKQRYAARDLHTLRHAMLTGVMRIINYFNKQTLKAILNTPLMKQSRLELNIWPYVDLPDELTVPILNALRALTGDKIDIALVNYSYEELTPSYVQSSYVAMVMYDYWNWLEVHSVNKNLVRTQIPNVALVGPQLIKDSESAEELKYTNTWEIIEKYSRPYVNLQLFPIMGFSTDLDRYVSAFLSKPK